MTDKLGEGHEILLDLFRRSQVVSYFFDLSWLQEVVLVLPVKLSFSLPFSISEVELRVELFGFFDYCVDFDFFFLLQNVNLFFSLALELLIDSGWVTVSDAFLCEEVLDVPQ